MQVWDHHHGTFSGILVVAGRMGCHHVWEELESEGFCWERVEWKTQRTSAVQQGSVSNSKPVNVNWLEPDKRPALLFPSI